MASFLKSKLWLAFSILVLVNFLDAWSTAFIVGHLGAEAEANPFVRYWIEVYGLSGLYAVKLVVLGILWLVAMHVNRYHREGRAYALMTRLMWAVTAVLSVVVVMNFVYVFRVAQELGL